MSLLTAQCSETGEMMISGWEDRKTSLPPSSQGLRFCGSVQHAHGPREHATCPFDDRNVDESGSLKGM